MARFTFGGTFYDMVASPDAGAGGALKLVPGATIVLYRALTGGTAETDFLVDADGNGTFETAATSISATTVGFIPPFQGPDGVSTLYWDPDPSDEDTRRLALVARDASSSGVPSASTTVSGIVTLATEPEAATGSDTTKAVTPAGAKAAVGVHEAKADPHTQYNDAAVGANVAKAGSATRTAILAITDPKQARSVLTAKGDIYVATASGTVDRLGVGSNGQALTADSTTATGLKWAASASGLAAFDLAQGTDSSTSQATTYQALSGLDVTTIRAGTYYIYYLLPFVASSTGGIVVKFRGGTGLLVNTWTLTGRWQGPNTIATPSNGQSGKSELVRYPTNTAVSGVFGGVADAVIEGTFKLVVPSSVTTDQTLGIEFKQNALDSTTATTVYGSAWGTVTKVA